ncbi:MAG: hypothetical protein CVT49_10915 [candidate division Zixibacteria bacterium HGW-Zixibacteria-1]|nr:MAG: hypothetical protein CVT49_10915 [candidate division Zixibacteria bacterium HGW-Zixibacteria-1]
MPVLRINFTPIEPGIEFSKEKDFGNTRIDQTGRRICPISMKLSVIFMKHYRTWRGILRQGPNSGTSRPKYSCKVLFLMR